MSMFKGTDGNYSSKRIVGITYLALALIVWFVKEVVKNQPFADQDVFYAILITGTSLLGLGIAEYFGKHMVTRKNTIAAKGPGGDTGPPNEEEEPIN